MRRADLDRVVEIEVDCFAAPWPREHFERLLEGGPAAVNRVLSREGRVLAYLCGWLERPRFKLNNLAVARACRRQGLGRRTLGLALSEAAAAGCNTALLEVRPSNTAALQLYASFGFRELSRIERYYREEGEDAIVLSVELGDSDA
jgi:ribosomal-protein-alanine N-acetyltransferase